MQVDNIANELVRVLDSSGSTGKMVLRKLRELLEAPTEEELDEMYKDYIESKSNGILNSF